MTKVQIRTNAKSFGEDFGVYDMGAKNFNYKFTDKGESFTDDKGVTWIKDSAHHKLRYFTTGQEGKFVKQEDYNHGTMEMNLEEARLLTKTLNEGTRNGTWVRLYIME